MSELKPHPLNENTKCCSKCESTKDKGEFSKQKASKDGLASQCKCCVKAYHAENKVELAAKQKAYEAENKVEIAAKIKAYQAENKVEIAAKRKAYQAENKVEIAAKRKAHRAENKVEIAAYKKAHYAENRDEFIENLKADIKARDIELDYIPYVLYHFKIGEAYKFGITRYCVDVRYAGEGLDLGFISECKEFIMPERVAKDLEKIISAETKQFQYDGESPFPNTGVTEMRAQSQEDFIEDLITEMGVERILL